MKNKLAPLLCIIVISTLISVMFSESYQKRFIYYRDTAAVLTYHHIDPLESSYTISPARFRNHLKAMKEHHYNVISVEDFIAFMEGKKRIPPNAVVITFDDGYESFYKYAYPELKKQNMTATNFIIVSYVGRPFMKPAILRWNQIIEMKKNGFSFYSHTFNTHSFTLDQAGKEISPLTSQLYKKSERRMENDMEFQQRILGDLFMAEQILKEKLGNQISLLCFPHGIYNKKVMDLSEQIGIRYFFTGKEGFNFRESLSTNRREIKRITAGSPSVTADVLLKKLTIPKMHNGVYSQ